MHNCLIVITLATWNKATRTKTVRFSHDDRVIAIGGSSGYCEILSAKDLKTVDCVVAPELGPYGQDGILGIQFSPDDRSIALWGTYGCAVVELRHHRVLFSRLGTGIISVMWDGNNDCWLLDEDGTILSVDLKRGRWSKHAKVSTMTRLRSADLEEKSRSMFVVSDQCLIKQSLQSGVELGQWVLPEEIKTVQCISGWVVLGKAPKPDIVK